jgi:molybdopterin/thiamine biosynthesis adenylyltransferase
MLGKAKVCILGCGGLGGYVIEMLSRIGIGSLTLVDGDVYDVTNLNRQLYSSPTCLGESKALIACERVKEINDGVKVEYISEYIHQDNAHSILKGHDIVIDALDNIETKRFISNQCQIIGIPMIYGAIAGWYGQVSTIFPGDRTMEQLYKSSSAKGKEQELGNPSFTPACIASIQVSEAIKLLTNKGEVLRNKFLFMNLLDNEYEIFTLQ